jgi:hypothetical protein
LDLSRVKEFFIVETTRVSLSQWRFPGFSPHRLTSLRLAIPLPDGNSAGCLGRILAFVNAN